MVDLFGKKKLDDRILELETALAKLEDEKEELLRTLEKREEKMRRLTSANQEANLALKAAEQKAAALTTPAPEPVERCEEQKPKARKLSLREMDLLMERLKACRSPLDDLQVAFYPGSVPEDAGLPQQIKKAAAAIKSRRGGIILHSPQLFTLQLIPPFPISES